jgi:dTDP-glucose pyrophosphorylase
MSLFIFPMAGNSSRFKISGFKKEKYELSIWNINLFEASIRSFNEYFDNDNFVFVTRSDHNNVEFIKKSILKLNIKFFDIIVLKSSTLGQASTVYSGLMDLNKVLLNQQLYIFNIDTIRPFFQKPKGLRNFLEVTKLNGDNWSFAEVNSSNNVIRTTEKVRISDLCSTGLYGFESSILFIKTYKSYIKMFEKESYIAPMYNLLIKDNINVNVSEISKDQVYFGGTPTEYRALLNTENPFEK